MKLIDKDKVAAEIERRIQFFTEESRNSNSDIVVALYGLKSFIDTLETKEVSLNLEAVVMPSDSSFWVNRDELSDFEDGDDVDILIIKK